MRCKAMCVWGCNATYCSYLRLFLDNAGKVPAPGHRANHYAIAKKWRSGSSRYRNVIRIARLRLAYHYATFFECVAQWSGQNGQGKISLPDQANRSGVYQTLKLDNAVCRES